MTTRPESPWPVLTLSTWEETRQLLHMWFQIVGKLRLALAPMVNHWWQVTLYVSARGLTTSLVPYGNRGFEAEFDFQDHVLRFHTTDGDDGAVELRSGSVAGFFAEVMGVVQRLGIEAPIMARPVEVPVSVPFAEDHVERAYDGAAAERFWHALVHAQRVMTVFRSRFVGKASPAHFFWGAPDLAVTRFSGRRAPTHGGGVPNCPDWVQVLAYSHEVSSAGFWWGGSDEGSFYSYAYPQPEGFSDWPVEPASAHYDTAFGEFLLPYAAVRTAQDPDAEVLRFFQSTYEAAAELGKWDRTALEVSR